MKDLASSRYRRLDNGLTSLPRTWRRSKETMRLRFSAVFNPIVALIVAVTFFIPIYITLTELPDHTHEDVKDVMESPLSDQQHTCLDPPQISAAGDGSLAKEEARLLSNLTNVQTSCGQLVLPGSPKHALPSEHKDLRGRSYVCVGGTTGLKKYDCLVYSFGIKHAWSKFPELVENNLGCRVYVFDPALDFIDHYHTKGVRFFNARLSNKDQQAQYRVPGEKGWKYRKFLTLIKELHFTNEPIDHMRLDITLDLWKGMSTMLNDGSLLTFVKQLSFEYDLNRKNATQVREMFAITRWLNRQGFLLAHSQPTKLSGKSYALLYVNTKMGTMLNDEGKFNQELVV